MNNAVIAAASESGKKVRLRKRSADHPGVDIPGMVLFLPAALLLLALFVLPVGYAFYLGFTDITLIGPTAVHFHFTGIKNVLRLGRDTLFWKSLWLTAVFLAGSVVGVTVVGMTAVGQGLPNQSRPPYVG